MNTKNDCWLCGRGYGIDNGGMNPGEMHRDEEGDMVCIYCEERISITVKIMDNPALLRLVGGIQALPKVEGVEVGLTFLDDDDA